MTYRRTFREWLDDARDKVRPYREAAIALAMCRSALGVWAMSKFEIFIASLIFWFGGAVMLSWVLNLARLWNWVFGP